MATRQIYLLDTSALARAGLPVIKDELNRLKDEGTLAVPPPVALEVGYMAQNYKQWTSLTQSLSKFDSLPLSAGTGAVAIGLQKSLWAAHKARAAGVFDTLIAAVALEHDACIVHYDRDYEHLASVCPALRTQWIVPPGSVS